MANDTERGETHGCSGQPFGRTKEDHGVGFLISRALYPHVALRDMVRGRAAQRSAGSQLSLERTRRPRWATIAHVISSVSCISRLERCCSA